MVANGSEPGISTIVRFHDPSRMNELETCLGSILGQDYRPIKVFIALQDFDPQAANQVNELLEFYNSFDGIAMEVKNFHFDDEADHRSDLINQTIPCVKSRYLAFLDFDDLIYPELYKKLIERLEKTDTVAAFAGCVRSDYEKNGEIRHVIKKLEIFRDKNKIDFLFENCFPLHSYVIDRTRAGDLPKFWVHHDRQEDYFFLFNLIRNKQIDELLRQNTMCEYYVDMAGTNTILAYRSDRESIEAWARTTEDFNLQKREATVTIRFSDLEEYIYKNKWQSSKEPLINNLIIHSADGGYGYFGWRRVLTPIVAIFVGIIGNRNDVENYKADPIRFFRELTDERYRCIGRILYPHG